MIEDAKKLRSEAMIKIKTDIDWFRSSSEATDYTVLIPSAEIDFALRLGIIEYKDYRSLRRLLDEAKKAREERSA